MLKSHAQELGLFLSMLQQNLDFQTGASITLNSTNRRQPMTKQSFNPMTARKLAKIAMPTRTRMTEKEMKKALEVRRRREDLEAELALKREYEGF